jgi:hypothetical protein
LCAPKIGALAIVDDLEAEGGTLDVLEASLEAENIKQQQYQQSANRHITSPIDLDNLDNTIPDVIRSPTHNSNGNASGFSSTRSSRTTSRAGNSNGNGYAAVSDHDYHNEHHNNARSPQHSGSGTIQQHGNNSRYNSNSSTRSSRR